MSSIDEDFIGFLAGMGRKMGFDSICGRIFAILLLDPGEVSLDMIAERTGYSLPTISNKMRMLESFGIVQRIRKPQSKKVYYHMENDLLAIFERKVDAICNNHLSQIRNHLPDLIARYKNQKLPSDEKQKLKVIQKFYKHSLVMEKFVTEQKRVLQKLRQDL